ncbi:glycosyltransferase family 39 protein [Candidatus Babeliales bacterium]|nr:glycosyltransferase family 39 protein [Candidatus Babeliales bacterium]
MKMRLLLVFFASFFVGCSYLLYQYVPAGPQAHQDIDSKAYVHHAQLFAQENILVKNNHTPYYTLGYPLIMGFIYKIFGQSTLPLIALQILLSLLSGFLLFVVAGRFFNPTIALISAALFACNIGYLTFSQFILTEICLSFFLLLFFERFTLFLQTAHQRPLIHSGLALGFSMLIKPAAALYFVIPLSFIAFVLFKKRAKTQVTIHCMSLFIVCFCAPIMLHMIHNKYAFGNFRLTELNEINLYFWFYPNVRAQQNGTTADYERVMLQKHAQKDGGMQEIKNQFFEDAKDNFKLFVYVWLANVAKTFCGLYTTNLKVLLNEKVRGGDISFFKMKGSWWHKIKSYIVAGANSWWLRAIACYEALWQPLRYLLCLVALMFIFGQKRYVLFYFFSSYLAYFSLITGHDGCARFRMMFEFLLIMLAAAGLMIVWMYATRKPVQKSARRKV